MHPYPASRYSPGAKTVARGESDFEPLHDEHFVRYKIGILEVLCPDINENIEQLQGLFVSIGYGAK